LNAQEFLLENFAENDTNNKIIKSVSFQNIHSSENSVLNEIDSILIRLEYKGYLNANLDTIFISDSIYKAQYVLGIQTKSLKVYYQNLPEIIFSKNKLQQISTIITDQYFEIPFSEIPNTLQFIVDNFEKYGNTFVQVSLQNIHLKNNLAIAEIKIVDNKPRTIDKVIIKGYENFPKNFITHELNLKIGSTFNKQKLINASIAINNLSFVEEQKPPDVLFTNDSTYIYLYLNKRRSNKFDGIIGFSSEEDKKGLQFNGYLDISVNNIFNSGETIALFWKNNGNDSQRFFINTVIPYVFNIPLIPEATFELYRQDSTFSNVTTDINLTYSINTKGKISAVLNTENSNSLLNNSINDIQSFKNIFYGVSYNFEKLIHDNLFPVKFSIDFGSLFGSRKIENTKSNQSKFLLLTNYIWTFNNKNYIFLQNHSAILNSDDYLNNELFRVGGIYNLRGVNEESIFASAYSIFNLEYRYRSTNSSYFYSITDFAFIENKILEEKSKILSLGLGYAFFTKVGLLNISYAIGKFDDNPFNFNNSKLHVKIISFF
jgi:outer membrane protein assembly factor BamA